MRKVAAGRQRAALGALAVLLGVIAGVVLTNRFVLQAEWWQVNRSVTHVPRPLLAALGPPPGPVATTWQLTTRVGDSDLPAYDRVAHGIADGQLIVVSGRGLEVRDARTGAERWHYRRSEWSVLGWTRTRRTIVVYLERTGHRDHRLMVGLDTVSGMLRWRAPRSFPAATERTTLRWPAGDGVVLVTDAGRHTLYGRSARTGARTWVRRLPPGCLLPEATPYASASSESVTALALDCDRRERVLAVDPASGHTLWTKYTEHAAVSVADDVTTVYDGKALRAYDRRGREFLVRAGEEICRDVCPALVTGGRLLIAYGPGRPSAGRSSSRRLEAVDIASGATAWHREIPGCVALAVSGGRLYALRSRLAEPLLPAGIDVVDPATGDGTTVPAPLVVRPDLDGARPWLGAGGGLLYVASATATPRPFGAARLVALRGGMHGAGPPELGGVPPDAWPDACALLTGRDLRARFDARPVTATVGARTVRAGCAYEPRRDRDENARASRANDPQRESAAVSVTVQWVARDAGAATSLFTASQANLPLPNNKVSAGDAAYALGARSGTVTMRVGRLVVTVTTAQPTEATRLAKIVAARVGR